MTLIASVTVGELIHTVPKSDALAALARLGKSPEGYARVYDELHAMRPVPTKMSCLLCRVGNKGKKGWVDVSGICEGTRWAIEFTEWPEWLSMPVLLDPTMGDVLLAEQLAHVLCEMTWAGYDAASVQARAEEIFDRIEESRDAFKRGDPAMIAQVIEVQREEPRCGSVADESPTRRDAPATKGDCTP